MTGFVALKALSAGGGDEVTLAIAVIGLAELLVVSGYMIVRDFLS